MTKLWTRPKTTVLMIDAHHPEPFPTTRGIRLVSTSAFETFLQALDVATLATHFPPGDFPDDRGAYDWTNDSNSSKVFKALHGHLSSVASALQMAFDAEREVAASTDLLGDRFVHLRRLGPPPLAHWR